MIPQEEADQEYRDHLRQTRLSDPPYATVNAILALANRVDQVLDIMRCEHLANFGPHDEGEDPAP